MSEHYLPRRLVRLIDPALEPVTLQEAKVFLRIDQDDENTLLSDIISTARIVSETQSGRSLITQSWRLSYEDTAPMRIRLPHGPVQAVNSVLLLDREGNSNTFSTDAYHLSATQWLEFHTRPFAAEVQINYSAGYGDQPTDVPADLRQALLIHLASLYEQRDQLSPPLAAQLLYAQHREIGL